MLGQQPVLTAIIEVKPQANPQSLANQYGVTLLGSIPELNKYLIQESSSSLTAIGKDHNVASVEFIHHRPLADIRLDMYRRPVRSRPLELPLGKGRINLINALKK